MTTYPPLSDLAAMPLHSGRLPFDDERTWFGCEFPERPADKFTLWDWRCYGCATHAKATLLNNGDSTVMWYATPDGFPQDRTLSWMVARSDYWRLNA